MRVIRPALLVICLLPTLTAAGGRRVSPSDVASAATASYDTSEATGATAAFSPCDGFSVDLPVGASAELDLGVIDPRYSGAALAMSVQADHIDLSIYDVDYSAWAEVSLSGEYEVVDGGAAGETTKAECFFKHVCAELCNANTARQTAEDVPGGGSGYVAGCILAEAAFRMFGAK